MVGGLNYDYLRLLLLSLPVIALSTLFYRRYYSVSKTPSHHSYPLIGNIIGFLLNRHRIHDWLTDTLSATPSLTLQVTSFLHLSHGIYTADPTNLQHILNDHTYSKGPHYTSVMQELLGTGIINSDMEQWLSQHNFARNPFNNPCMETLITNTVQSQLSNSLIPHLSSSKGETIDLQQVFQTFTFDIMCNVTLGVNPCFLTTKCPKNSDYVSFVEAFDVAVQHISDRFMSPLPAVWKLKRFLNIGSERKYKKAIRTVDQFVIDIVKSKERQNGYISGVDLLSKFIFVSLNMGYNYNAVEERWKFLRDNVISFIFAGKDSTATALTWFFWLLDGHPHCKDLIRKEFSKLITSSNNTHPLNFSYDDMNKLNYLHAALTESMRLFPPVPINSRSTTIDDILPDGTYLEQGWFVDYSIYAMGRMEKIWGADCREFKPERWLNGDGVFQRLAHCKYPVFFGGCRVCLGKEMAYFLMKSVVVAVMHEFEIEVVGGGGTPEKIVEPPYKVSIFLSMKNGLPVRVKKREQSHGPRVKDGGVMVILFGMVLVGLSLYKHKRKVIV